MGDRVGVHEEQAKGGPDSVSNKWQLPVAIASLILGLAISLQFRTTNSTLPPSAVNTKDLLAQLRAVESERNRLSAEVAEQRDQSGDREKGNKELEAMRLQAGLVAMKGPGVVVRLSDSPRTPAGDDVPYDFIVHDIDVLVLVNELWASGAEAVAVNDQRIVARSSIRCVGPTVLVNTNREASPFIVRAIGDSDRLEGGLKMPGGFLDSMNRLTSNGGEVAISRMREVRVPAFQDSLIYRYAIPVDGEPTKDVATPVGDMGLVGQE